MKIWVDDLIDQKGSGRETPSGYVGVHSVNEAIRVIEEAGKKGEQIEVIDLDHDLGSYASDGGDAINLLDYLRMNGLFYPIAIHTSNPVGRANMVTLVKRAWPEELHIH